jgi:drug/metabolite transporter (DMT)-like permease
MLIGGLALGSAFMAGVGSVVITPVAKQGMAVRLLALRSGFAVLFISVGLFALPREIGFGTVTSLGVVLTLVVSGPAFALGALIYYRGIRSLGLARAYPLVGIFPLFSTVMAVLLLGERPHWLVVAGTIIVVAGVGLVAPGAEQRAPQSRVSADRVSYRWMAIMAGAALLFAVCNTANKVALEEGLSPLLVNLGRTVCAGSLATVAGLARGRGLSLRTLPRMSWALIATSALAVDLVGNCMYLAAMQFGQVSTVVPLASTSPLFVIPIAHVVLKETITWPVVVGSVLTMVGAIIVAMA